MTTLLLPFKISKNFILFSNLNSSSHCCKYDGKSPTAPLRRQYLNLLVSNHMRLEQNHFSIK